MRVHVGQLTGLELHTGIFREHQGAMSVDWERYSTPSETRNRHPDPNSVGVITLGAGAVRSIDGMEVRHEPVQSNRAHSGIHGLLRSDMGPPQVRKTMVRTKLFKLVKGWELKPKNLLA